MMKARVSLNTTFCASIVLLVASVGFADSGVEVVNPGFEQLEPQGAIAGWQLVEGESSEGATFTGEGESAYDGIGSARLAVKGHGTVTAESAEISLEVGKLYRLSGWIRTEGAVSDPLAKYPTAVPACLSMKACAMVSTSGSTK